MIVQLLIAFSSAFALGHCLFLSVFCWQAGHKQIALRWLAGLLLALAIRLSKSVAIVLLPGVPYVVPATGLVGMLTIGPFLWFYIRQGLQPNRPFHLRDYIHFALSAIVAVWQFYTPSEPVIFGHYALAAAHIAAYMGTATWAVYRQSVRQTINPLVFGWLKHLLGGLSLIWGVFVIQLFSPGLIIYIGITITASLVLYGISFWGLRQSQSLTTHFINATPLVSESLRQLAEQTKQVLENDQLYTDSTLTLPKLAGRLKVPVHVLSKALNQTYHKTFPELLIEYRIRAVTQRLLNPAFAHFNLEAIATECGFNSMSTFYTAFKKVHGLTPVQYQKRYQETNVTTPVPAVAKSGFTNPQCPPAIS